MVDAARRAESAIGAPNDLKPAGKAPEKLISLPMLQEQAPAAGLTRIAVNYGQKLAIMLRT